MKNLSNTLSSEKNFIIAIGLFSFIIRILFVVLFGNFQNPVMHEHGEIARNMMAGHGFSMHWPYTAQSNDKIEIQSKPPLYEGAFIPPISPYYIYIVFLVVGDNFWGYAVLMLLNSIFSVIGVFILYYIVKQSNNLKAARISSFTLALFLPNVYSTITFTGSSVYQTIALLFIFFLIKTLTRLNYKYALLLGLSGGILTLIRSEFLLIGPVLMLTVYSIIFIKKLFNQTNIKIIITLIISLTMFASIVSPWIYRNTMLFGKFTTIISHPWHELFRGNNIYSSGGTKNILGEETWADYKRFPDLINTFDSLPYNQQFELAIDSVYKTVVIKYWKEHTVHAVLTMLKRFLFIWTIDFYTPRAREPVYAFFVIITLIPFVIGTILLIKKEKFEKHKIITLPLISFLILYSLFFTIVNLETRYQVYMLTIAHISCGFGWIWIFDKFKSIFHRFRP